MNNYMKGYITGAVIIGVPHCYISYKLNSSPLTWPFIFVIWKDISYIRLGSDGFEVEKITMDVDKSIRNAAHGGNLESGSLDILFKSV